MRSFRFLGEAFHIFTLPDCGCGHNILVAGICLSAARLLLYYLHSCSMLSGGASLLLRSREEVRLLTAGFIIVTSAFPCEGHESTYKIFYFCKYPKAVT